MCKFLLAAALGCFFAIGPTNAQVLSTGAGSLAGGAAIKCDVLANSGDTLSTKITATPASGILCVGTGTYSVGGGITLSTAITITGYPLQSLCQPDPSLGAVCPGIPTGAIPTFMPALTESSSASMFTISANNVLIQGLSATGNTPNITAVSCTGAEFASPQSGKTGTVINGNYLTNFTCAIEGLNTGAPFDAKGNYLAQNTYVGLGCSACAAGGSVWQGNMAYKIGQNTSGVNNGNGSGGYNDYPFVLTFSGATVSSGFTIQYNTSIDSTIWEDFDNHDGNTITWQNNLGVGAGTTTSGAHNHNAVTNGMTTIQVKNNVIDAGSNVTLHDSIDLCALTTCSGSSGMSGTNVISGNTILYGSGNGCVMSYSSVVSPTSNNGGSPCGTGKNANTVSSITLSGWTDGTPNQFIHGQANHTIAAITVNMTDAAWSWPQPPGVVTISGASPAGCAVVVGLQLVQAAAGSSSGTCTFSLVATLPGMKSSPFTQAGFSLTGN